MKQREYIASYINCRRLHHLGMVLNTQYFWVAYENFTALENSLDGASYKKTQYTDLLTQEEYDNLKEQSGITIISTYPAPHVGELGAVLPAFSSSCKDPYDLWDAFAPPLYPRAKPVHSETTEANARCKLLIAICEAYPKYPKEGEPSM